MNLNKHFVETHLRVLFNISTEIHYLASLFYFFLKILQIYHQNQNVSNF